MRPEQDNPREPDDMIVVSDVHMRESTDERAKRLRALLESIQAPYPRHLILLGDIFDFCLGSSSFFRAKFAFVGKELERVAASGTRVVFFEGNHEFSMPEAGWKGVEVTDDPGFVLTFADGTRVKLGHGDLLKRDPAYALFRSIIKARITRFIASIVPQTWLNWYTLRHARRSRSKDEYRHLDVPDLIRRAREWTVADECHLGVFGHFHVMINEPPRPDGLGGLACAPGWDSRPGYLRVRGRRVDWISLS